MKLTIKIIAAIICALIAWEVILNTTMYRTPGTHMHPVLGKIYNKGILLWGKEGFSISKINSLGLRGDEIPPKKQNEIRILSLGDSYTEALHVPLAKSYSKLLESYFNTKAEKQTVSVVNAGRSGDSPANYIYLADYLKQELKPDYVIVTINDKDFTEDLLNKNREIYLKNDGTDYKAYKNANFISINPIKQKLPQLAFLADFSSIRIGVEATQKMFAKKSTSVKNIKLKQEDNYASLVDWTIKELKNKYENLVILYLPDIDYKNTEKAPSDYEELMKKYTVKNNVKLINMRDAFIKYYETNKQPAHGFNNTKPGQGHINKIGHYLTAQKLIEYFKEEAIK